MMPNYEIVTGTQAKRLDNLCGKIGKDAVNNFIS